ncbi:Uncharacterised protein [Chlamydia trachomatis]|nr:Uncharacterised protein [Chlamydia trachomatis]
MVARHDDERNHTKGDKAVDVVEIVDEHSVATINHCRHHKGHQRETAQSLHVDDHQWR